MLDRAGMVACGQCAPGAHPGDQRGDHGSGLFDPFGLFEDALGGLLLASGGRDQG